MSKEGVNIEVTVVGRSGKRSGFSVPYHLLQLSDVMDSIRAHHTAVEAAEFSTPEVVRSKILHGVTSEEDAVAVAKWIEDNRTGIVGGAFISESDIPDDMPMSRMAVGVDTAWASGKDVFVSVRTLNTRAGRDAVSLMRSGVPMEVVAQYEVVNGNHIAVNAVHVVRKRDSEKVVYSALPGFSTVPTTGEIPSDSPSSGASDE